MWFPCPTEPDIAGLNNLDEIPGMPFLRARQQHADLETFVDIRHKGRRRLVRRGADVCWIG